MGMACVLASTLQQATITTVPAAATSNFSIKLRFAFGALLYVMALLLRNHPWKSGCGGGVKFTQHARVQVFVHLFVIEIIILSAQNCHFYV